MTRSRAFASLFLVSAFSFACHHASTPVNERPTASATAPPITSANAPPGPREPVPAIGWNDDKQARHALSRLAYGPRPADLAAVKNVGAAAWVRAQLKPATLDDEVVASKLKAYPSATMTSAELLEHYPRKNAAPPPATAGSPTSPAVPSPAAPAGAMPPAGGAGAMTSDAALGKKGDVVRELIEQKLLRAALSERQLQEVLVDFWFNHFNVYADKGVDAWLVTSYERDAIRPFVFGRFRDLLGATARHPAMLFYLDNFQSKAGALNENYGRELLELHTLGVDGGYSQDDVREAARAFTGWGIERPREAAAFVFRPRAHEKGPKTVLGTSIDAGGEADGEKLLDLLARHPATARHLARKLATHFVSDDPPAALVDKLTRVYLESDGDLARVYEALFFSPEFWSDAAYGAKTKTPLELVVSAARAVGAEVDDPSALAAQVGRMGEALYRCQPPTGYKDTADAWVGSGALVARINFGVALAGGRLKGVVFDRDKLLAGAPPADPPALVDALAAAVLHEPPSAGTREVVVAEIGKNSARVPYQEPAPTTLPQALGLLLGSPEFQKR